MASFRDEDFMSVTVGLIMNIICIMKRQTSVRAWKISPGGR